jgi:hypothetical protein
MFEKDEAREIFGGFGFVAPQDSGKMIFEEAADVGAIGDFAAKQLKSKAMACVLSWVEQGDYGFGALADSVAGIADLDGDGEYSDEEAYYNDLLTETGNALVSLGGSSENVQTFIDNEDDEEGAKLGAFLSEKMQAVEEDDETIIANYAVATQPVMEATIKVVRGGKVVFKQKRMRKVHLSAAQKVALKTARRKAFTGAARIARKKSMRIRKQRGL